MQNQKHPQGPSPRETNPQPAPLPEPENRPAQPAQNEGDEGGGTSTLSNEEMKRPARH